MWPFRTRTAFTELGFSTDIHSHILPGVDDGFRTEDQSLAALRELNAMGVRRMILTPHIFPELYEANTPERIRGRFSGFSEKAAACGVECRIAGEHMVYPGIEPGFKSETAGEVLSLGGGHVLIEMSYAYESQNIREFIFHLNAAGFHPVLAHPERYLFYPEGSEDLDVLADMDTEFQLNILSLGGFYGRQAMEKAVYLLEKGAYSYLGTDLHSLSQINQLKSLRIEKKHLPAVEKLIAGNEALWNVTG